MKQKIIEALKTKYSNLGFSKEALNGVASYLEKTVTDESQIDNAVGGVEPLLKVFQADADRVRTENATLKAEREIARRISGKDIPNLLVYGGGKDVRDYCVKNSLVYVEQLMVNKNIKKRK